MSRLSFSFAHLLFSHPTSPQNNKIRFFQCIENFEKYL